MGTLLASPRLIFALIFATSVILLGTAFYMEYIMLLDPCPLCMMQRIWVGIAGLVALAAALHGRGQRNWAFGVIGTCAIGGGFSIRQLYLQNLPPEEVPACGPSLDYMLEAFPFTEVLQAMVMGTGNCAEVSWTLLGLSIPAWVLIGFIGFAIGAGLAARAAAEPAAG